jgi:nucleotide-binding universal stress UspA family protein
MMKDRKMSPTTQKAMVLVLLANFGCGGGSTVPFTDNSQDADKYALSVKQAVSDQVAGAMSSSEPADQISTLVTLLENPDNRPSGPHEAIYLEILDAAKDISIDLSATEGRPEGLEETLAKLKALADKLPGTVKETVVEGEPDGGGMAEQD